MISPWIFLNFRNFKYIKHLDLENITNFSRFLRNSRYVFNLNRKIRSLCLTSLHSDISPVFFFFLAYVTKYVIDEIINIANTFQSLDCMDIATRNFLHNFSFTDFIFCSKHVPSFLISKALQGKQLHLLLNRCIDHDFISKLSKVSKNGARGSDIAFTPA